MSTKKSEEKTKKIDNKKKKEKFSKRHPKISLFIKIVLLIILLLIVIASGIVIGMIYGDWGAEFEITEDELIISASNSVVLDKDGNKLAELTGDENRKIITLNEMNPHLKEAYVAIEDERFYEHHGVDYKRTIAAIANYVLKSGDSSFGGSSITQQLVKNITKEDQREGKAGVIRKIKEWAKAYQIERMISKDQILELYLNILFVGGTNYGVEVGSNYYFNKSAADLSLAQCAFLAGINSSPNSYNPYGESGYNENASKKEKINNRVKTVLSKMLELGYITQEEFDTACLEVDNGLAFQQAESMGTLYSYHTDAAIAQLIEDIAEEKQISTSMASTYVYSSGLTIYTTQDTELQNQMNSVMVDDSKSYSRNSKDDKGNPVTSQAAMVVIDNETGYAVGVVGGLGAKTESRGLNRATQSTRQTGSSIKPLTSLVPGINEGIITASTIYDDCATEFQGKYTPKDYNAYKGLISIRSAVTTSQNIPFIKVVAEMTPAKSIDYLERMGVSSIDKQKDGLAAVSIGGFTNGISPLQMAAAYATIENDGVYRTPLLYTKVVDSKGETVFEAKQDVGEVISKQASYVIKDILKSVVQSGTATYCKISGMDVAAKTGTTNSNYDKWLCGFTNYYTGAAWYGFDTNVEVKGSNNVAGKIWSAVMSKLHKGKPASSFERPDGVVTATICRVSGKRATNKCSDTYQEIFVDGTVPGECDAHGSSAQICQESGLLANEFCPNPILKYYSYTVEKERLGLWRNMAGSSSTPPTTTCTIHNAQNTVTHEPSAPIITLKGETNMTLYVGNTYEEQGATAKDEKDGDITSKIITSGKVDTTKPGKYTVTYTVENSSGKKTIATRIITVKEKEVEKPPAVENPTGGNKVTPEPVDPETKPKPEPEPEPDEEQED